MTEQRAPSRKQQEIEATAPPELARVREGEQLDWQTIEAHLRRYLPSDIDTAGSFEVLQFPNGAANLTYLIRLGSSELVLRRPPFGVLAPGAHDMKREYKVLSKLWRNFDKAPRAFLFCDDHAVAGADFFVMERRHGDVIRSVLPDSMTGVDDVGRRLGFALIDAIAEFHLLDPESCGLADLGKPDGFVERQVFGWKKRWDLVQDTNHHDQMTALHIRFADTLPQSQSVSFVHNDLKLDNAMFRSGDPDHVEAFFDWDMTTLGDPLVDLGTLLNYWPDPSDGPDARRAHPALGTLGLPARSEITRRYGDKTGFDVSAAAWYEAFGQWKTAVVLQQLHYRWLQGDSTDARMEFIADGIPMLMSTADALLESIGI